MRRKNQISKLKLAFRDQRRRAKRRGIEFLFTFEEWLDVWECSGKLALRGPGKNGYCMSRPGDVGPYAPWNVVIKTISENSLEAAPYGRKISLTVRKKMSASRTGVKRKPFSAKTRLKMSISARKKRLSPTHKINIGKAVSGERNGFYGKTHSEETKHDLIVTGKQIGRAHV